jgi:acyl-CoA synthetase (AMP-forming)/AMP-acid ligase II
MVQFSRSPPRPPALGAVVARSLRLGEHLGDDEYVARTLRRLRWGDLYREVNEFASLFREVGIGADDVVTLHPPMVPELPIAMLAAARIGASHSEGSTRGGRPRSAGCC